MMKQFSTARPGCRSDRRGSVFLLVLAMLTVLALISVTLTYTAQTETAASRNIQEGMQARVSAVTGIPAFKASVASVAKIQQGAISTAAAKMTPRPDRDPVLVKLTLEAPAPGDSAFRTMAPPRDVLGADSATAPPGPLRSVNLTLGDIGEVGPDGKPKQPSVYSSLGKSTIEDESAKIDINALIPSAEEKQTARTTRSDLDIGSGPAPLPEVTVEDFAAFIQAVLIHHGVSISGSPRQLAEAISQRRYGPDGKPGASGKDDNGNGGKARLTTDQADNDQDSVVDNIEEEARAMDADGLDNNRDGRIDEPGESIDDDGLDNNHDGKIDDGNESVDEPTEFSSDIRRIPFGDDRPYTRLEDLLALPGMTPGAFEVLKPYLTVFSVSRAAYLEKSGADSGFPQLDPNTAAPKEIYRVLEERYPDLPGEVIGQYVANLVDRRDKDDIPSELQLGPEEKTYYGVEITPLINEVCPDVASLDQDGDDGQYVEIANPFSKPMNLLGYRLEAGGKVISLSGSLPPSGFLVVTDDYDESLDTDPERQPGMGSLYDIFGVVATGGDRRVQVEPEFNLPNDAGTVKLFNKDGALIDSFEYHNGTFSGAKLSFQRRDPRLRQSELAYATPLAPNFNAPPADDTGRATMKVIESLQNKAFTSALELLLVPTIDPEFAVESGAEPVPPTDPATSGSALSTSGSKKRAWRFPSLPGEEIQNFDTRLVDLFVPEAPRRHDSRIARIQELKVIPKDSLQPTERPDAVADRWLKDRDEAPALFGRINLNTAAPALLASLPGFTPELAARVAQLRGEWAAGVVAQPGTRRQTISAVEVSRQSQSDAWFQSVPPQAMAKWDSLSAFLEDNDLWDVNQTLIERINTVFPFSRLVTFDSLSFKITSENLPDPQRKSEKRRPSLVHSERIVAADRGRLETVTFTYGNSTDYGAEDRDLRNIQTSNQMPDLAEEILRRAEQTPKRPTGIISAGER